MLDEIKKTYKYFKKHSGYKYAKHLYQKNVGDYFINCFVFSTGLQFEAQLNHNEKTINIILVSGYETIDDVERLFQEQRVCFSKEV